MKHQALQLALVVSVAPGVVCYLWAWGGFEGHVWSQQLVGTECLCMSVEPAPQISGSICSFPRQQSLTGLWHSGRHCLGIQTEKKTQTNDQEISNFKLNKSCRLLFAGPSL